MPLVDLSQVKAYLWIDATDTTDDTRLQSVLTSVLDTATQLVGDLSNCEKTITVLNASIKDDTLYLQHANVTTLNTINGVDFEDPAKVLGTDYILRPDGTAIVLDLSTFIDNDFGSFDVTYTSGWTEDDVPDDFVGIISDMCAIKFSQDYGRNIIEETTGPRTVRFENNANKWNNEMGLCKKRLRKYLPSHLRLW